MLFKVILFNCHMFTITPFGATLLSNANDMGVEKVAPIFKFNKRLLLIYSANHQYCHCWHINGVISLVLLVISWIISLTKLNTRIATNVFNQVKMQILLERSQIKYCIICLINNASYKSALLQ